MIIDGNTNVIFSTIATIFGAFLGLLGVFVVFKFEAYEKKMNNAYNRILEYENKVIEAKREENQELANNWQKFLDNGRIYHKALKNERVEYIKKFLFTASLITFVLIFSILMLSFSKMLINLNILINLNFGIMVVFFGVAFSIVVILIIFLFIISSFPVVSIQFRNDAQPKSKWYQFWKWVRWDLLFFRW